MLESTPITHHFSYEFLDDSATPSIIQLNVEGAEEIPLDKYTLLAITENGRPAAPAFASIDSDAVRRAGNYYLFTKHV